MGASPVRLAQGSSRLNLPRLRAPLWVPTPGRVGFFYSSPDSEWIKLHDFNVLFGRHDTCTEKTRRPRLQAEKK